MAIMNLESDISSFVNTIYEGALLVTRENNLMAALVTQFGDRTGLAVRSNQQYGGATVNTIGEDDDLVGQAFTPTAIATLTPTEKGAQYFLTDSRVETDPFPVRADAAQDLGMAMATKFESDLLGHFDEFTGGTIGTAGSVITWSYFFNMLSVLRNAKAPMPYVCVLHPYQWGVLGKATAPGATVTNSPRFQDAISQNFYVGSVSGVEIYTSANIAAGTAVYCGMFNRQALALDVRRAPRLEVERDASRRGYELNFTSVYATGVWRPAFGVQGIFDASTPTT
jgi:hypothetical protein